MRGSRLRVTVHAGPFVLEQGSLVPDVILDGVILRGVSMAFQAVRIGVRATHDDRCLECRGIEFVEVHDTVELRVNRSNNAGVGVTYITLVGRYEVFSIVNGRKALTPGVLHVGDVGMHRSMAGLAEFHVPGIVEGYYDARRTREHRQGHESQGQ